MYQTQNEYLIHAPLSVSFGLQPVRSKPFSMKSVSGIGIPWPAVHND